MNDDEFETKLHALTSALQRPDPTPEWKADILARARREAHVGARTRVLPPRWLMATWAAAWAVILVLHFTAPADAPSRDRNVDDRTRKPEWAPAGQMSPLLAFHPRTNLNLEIP